MVDCFYILAYYDVAFAHEQDKTTLRSDLSGSWDFTSGSGVLVSLLFARDKYSHWKTKAINLGGLGAEPQDQCISKQFVHGEYVVQLLVLLPVLGIFKFLQNPLCGC